MTTAAPAPNPYGPTEPVASAPNSLARASFVIAIVLVAVALIFQIVGQVAPLLMIQAGWDSLGIGVLFAVASIVELILGMFGFVLGFVGARRGGAVLQAGIGIGVGGFVAITALVSLLVSPMLGLLY